MKTTRFILAVMTILVGNMSAGTDEQQIVSKLSTMFAALSTEDATKFHSVISADFYLFEGGARYDGDTITGLIKAMHAAGKRYKWNLTEPDVHISGNTAWIAYVNKGSVTDASGTAKQNWLESAFLEKRVGSWKVVFLHSTRVTMKPEGSQSGGAATQ